MSFSYYKTSKMNTILKNGLAIGAGAYFTAYALLSGYALIDYKINKEKIEENAPNHLIINKYSVNVSGKKKELTLVGERHLYNKKEQRTARDFVRDYEYIASEGSVKHAKNKLYEKTSEWLSYPSSHFYIMGSGRSYADTARIIGIYRMFGMPHKNPIALEKEPADNNFNFGQKAVFLWDCVKSLSTAPLKYFKGKNERNISKEKWAEEAKKGRNSFTWTYLNSGKRENEMSEKIGDILNKGHVNKLAVFVGASHLENIAHSLEMKMKMEKRK